MDHPTPDRTPPDPSATASGSTETLFGRAMAGDQSAARSLVARFVPRLRRWGRGRLPSYARGAADTEDIAQDAALGALRRLDAIELRSVHGLPAYMRRSFMNVLFDAIRRVRGRGPADEITDELVAGGASPLEAAIRGQEQDRVRLAAARLSASERQILFLRLYDDRSFAEIRQIVGKGTDDAARMAFNRALEHLAAELGLR